MTIQTPAIAVPAPRRGPGRRLGLGIAAGAVIAVAAGAGLWQANRGGDATETASPPTAAVERAAVARPARPAPTVYVVGTEAQAEAMQRGIADADAIRMQLGEAPLADQVTVVSDAEADAFFRMKAEQDALRAEMGLPSLTIVDLRPQPGAAPAPTAPTAPTAAATPADTRGGLAELIGDGGTPPSLGLPAASATTGAARPTFVYLVSTEEEAAAVRASAPDDMAVVWGTEEADRLLRALDDLAPLGLRLVDRRFPPAAAPTGERSVGCESGLGAGASDIGAC